MKKQFEIYSVSHLNDKQRISDESPEQIFAHFFFMGLTLPNEVWEPGGIEVDAYNLGQAYWKNNTNKHELILASYGYVRVDIDGIWQCGFEQSSFSPKGRKKKEEWWVSSFRGASMGNQLNLNCNKIQTVRAVGFLSPIGTYGHLGAYKRQILFTSFTKYNAIRRNKK